MSKASSSIREWLSGGGPPEPEDLTQALSLAREAIGQGLAALLLNECGRWPHQATALLAEATTQARLRGAIQRQAGVSAIRTLEALGVDALALKGLATAGRLYDRLEERPMRDVDLLLLEPRPSLSQDLVEHGFRPMSSDPDHAFVFQSPEGVELELHRSLASPNGFHPLPAGSLRARARLGPDELREVSSADLLAHLSLHAAFQHGLALRLSQWLDLKRLLEREAPDPAATLLSLAEHEAGGCAWAALCAERALFGDRRADPLIEALEPLIPVSLKSYLGARLADPDSLIEPARPPLARLRWLLAQGRRTRLLIATLSRPGRGPLALARRAFRLARRIASEALTPRSRRG